MDNSHSSFTINEIIGILVNLRAKMGDLTRIKMDAGNEEAISHINYNMSSLLTCRNYMKDGCLTPESIKFSKELTCFFIHITEHENDFPGVEIGEYQHLTYNVPKISKFLMTKLVVSLKLTEIYCEIVEQFQLNVLHKLFDEFVQCLDKSDLTQSAKDSCILIKFFARLLHKLSNEKDTKEFQHLLTTSSRFLNRIDKVTTEQLAHTKKNIFFKLVGYQLNDLLDILLFCSDKNVPETFVNDVFRAILIVVQSVSVDMYLFWAEVIMESCQALQLEIGEKAYEIIGKYSKNETSRDVMKMLEAFASKPKNLNEQVWYANVDRKIYMVNKQDKNQKTWLMALINSSEIFTNVSCTNCLEKWSHICDENDVGKILDNALTSEDIIPSTELAMKCAKKLELPQLILLVLRHFSSKGFIEILNISNELTNTFNRLQNDGNENTNVSKDFLMYLLCDPKRSMNFLLEKYLENVIYLNVTKLILVDLKNVFKLDKFTLVTLREIMKRNAINEENLNNFVAVFQAFLDVGIVKNDELITELVVPIWEHFNTNEYAINLLRVLNEVNFQIPVRTSEHFIVNLFEVLKLRTNFLEHDTQTQNLVQEVVKLIRSKIKPDCCTEFPALNLEKNDKLTLFYEKLLSDSKCKFLNVICDGKFNLCTALKYLPVCVPAEWEDICSCVIKDENLGVLLDLLRDFMSLLCLNVESMRKSEKFQRSFTGLIYITNQVGIVLQNLSTDIEEDDQVKIAEFIVDLLCVLPDEIKENEGMNLVNLMPKRCLSSMKTNAGIVAKICQIKNGNICKIIAEKILTS